MGALTDSKIPRLKPGKHSDGRGLSLLVTETGKLWRYRFQWEGKEQNLPLGAWPDILVEVARTRLQEARTKVKSGVNPCAEKKAAKQTAKAATAGRFRSVCDMWLARFYPADNANRARIVGWLTTYFYPSLGDVPIAQIRSTDINACLDALVDAGKIDTAHRAFAKLIKIWPWAVGRGLAARNILEDLGGQLPPRVRNKFPGLTDPAAVGQLLRAIDAYPARKPQIRICMQLMPYFAQRPSELREATWPEFDLEKALWRIPPSRMKVGKKVRPPHAVPIPKQALALLRKLSLLSESVEVPVDIESTILELRAKGYGKNKIARMVGVGNLTVQQLVGGGAPPKPKGRLPDLPLDYHNVASITALRKPTGYLFPSREHRNVLSVNQPFSDATINKALRALGYCTDKDCAAVQGCDKPHHSGHGWRTTFSTLARDALHVNFHAKEQQLSHGTPGVAGDYDEATDIEVREPMMQKWADYLDKLRTLPAASQGRSAKHAAMNSSMSDSSHRTA